MVRSNAARGRRTFLALAALTLIAAACGRSAPSATPSGATSGGGSGSAPGSGSGSGSPSGPALATTTTPGTQPVDRITWAVYRETNSLDPIYAFDYPENTVVALICESLLRQGPDGSIGPGLATLSYTDQTHLVFTLKDGLTFWDGSSVTPDDVVYSLQRNQDSSLGGFYGAVFSRVSSIKATGANQITITLKEPDYWLPGELASMPGVVLEKSYVQSKGADYGTAKGGAMCTGDYKFDSWTPGNQLAVVRNDTYWNPSVHPLVREIDFKGAPDITAFTSGMLTGAIDGSFSSGAVSTLDQLVGNSAVTVTRGQSWATDAFIVSNAKGPLADVRVRQALSLAIDRQGMIDQIYKGAAQLPHSLSNPGTWGYAKDVFGAAYAKLPPMTQDIDKAKSLIEQAGATGKTIVLGMSSELNDIATEAGAYQTAAAAIGLKATLKSVSAANYINFFIDAKARQGVDGFFTLNYGDYADPAALLATLVLPDGSQNYDGYNNSQITDLMEQARGTEDPTARANLMVQAQQLIVQDLPWIPDVMPENLLITSSKLTGAVASFDYMFAPWADTLGGTG